MAKENIGFMRRMLRSLELPEDVDLSVPCCTMIGRRDLLIENHRGIVGYSGEAARFLSEEGDILVTGGDLVLTEFDGERALVRGRIDGILFEARG